MRTFLRYVLVLLAVVGVGSLGYYAYILSTDTFSLPFVGQDKQSGGILRIVLGKPGFLAHSYNTSEVVDTGALLSALSRNGKKWNPLVSGEGRVVVSGEYLEIASNVMNPGDTIFLDRELYNTAKTTKYRLPRDFQLTMSDVPRGFEVRPVGLPKNAEYEVSLYGYGELTPSDIRWYMHTQDDKNCTLEDAWDSRMWKKITPAERSSHDSSQIAKRTYALGINPRDTRLCIIAGIGGDFAMVEDRRLAPLSATGKILSVLSPEYDMKSEIQFQFSSDIYADTGALYSPEYFENRKQAKLEFLKKIDINPLVALTEENIALTPDRATLVGNFVEGQKYSIKLRDVEDIYGRKTASELDFTPKSEPFLSLGLDKRRTIFRSDEALPAKLYSLKTPKDTYTLKLCRISLEGYARTERIIEDAKKEYYDTLYSMLDTSKDVSECTKKDIVIASGSSITPFDVRELLPAKKITPGLYILAFRDKADITAFERFVAPRVFSIVDSQITMKVDASGKMNFLVTDITTGAPRPSQNITLAQNIGSTYRQTWNNGAQKYDIEYLPISTQIFSSGISLTATDQNGFAKAQKDTILKDDYNSPYGLMNEPYWDYEGRYSSFLATSSGDGHFGYVVSTWNDGITGWNFGLKDSDYSWETRGKYTSYIHTDRRLYLPGETVYVHAILRENGANLAIPVGKKFTVNVTDALGGQIESTTLEPNEFGTIAFDFALPKEASLGSYNVSIVSADEENTYIQNGYTSFQVEVFKNPTFTADVTLRSPDISEQDTVENLREKVNTDPNMPWYDRVYGSTLALEGIVRARYYNGSQIRSVPFTYRIYKAPHYDDGYWGDCFWGCYFEPTPEFYTEGTGSIDRDGLGAFRVPVEFSSFSSDYVYTAEVTIVDPMTGEEVVTPATLLARLPAEYKSFSLDNPLMFIPEKKILQKSEKIVGKVAPLSTKWDDSLKGKYRYDLILRKYENTPVDDLRNPDAFLSTKRDIVILGGVINTPDISIPTQGFDAGEYHLRISPIVADAKQLPETAITDTLLYLAGDFQNKDANLRVIPEKTVYHLGEKARVMIVTPFTGGHLYLTRERGGVIESEYIKMTGKTLIREYTVDESFFPNVYIGAVAFPDDSAFGKRNYAVGYGEIVGDMSDKKGTLSVTPNKPKYENGETVSLDITFSDRVGNPLQGEVAVMVVDESLIRLLGNIDLDILPKFFQKYPFTTKTALTAIGMERNRFLSRKGSNGGSGDKGGGGLQIASRVLFKNTAYFNPSVRTDARGKGKVSFVLPDNVTDYRIITIGQTKDAKFAVNEKTIEVRRNYTLETHVPSVLYPGDTTTFTISAFNATDTISSALITLSVGSGASIQKYEKTITLQAKSGTGTDFSLKIPETWRSDTPYTVSLSQKGKILDRVEKSFRVLDIPLLETTLRQFGVMTGTTLEIKLPPSDKNTDREKSSVSLMVGNSLLLNPKKVMDSLISYPYGCIEQTIAGTLPNAFALKFGGILGLAVDKKVAEENLQAGLAKMLRMQYFGGWKYWETDSEANFHVTPYVLRSLFLLRDLGFAVPQSSIDAGLEYLSNLVEYGPDIFDTDLDFRSETYATLARAGHPKAEILRLSLQAKFQSSSLSGSTISRHGYLMYAYGLFYQKKLTGDVEKYLDFLMRQENPNDYWYWSSTADEAIYAQFLLDTGKQSEAIKNLDELLRGRDLSSYFVSTQEKIQILSALFKLSKSGPPQKINIALRSEGIIADLSLSSTKTSSEIVASREKIGDTLKITRTGKLPLYFEVVERYAPKDILLVPARSREGMKVTRIFEKVDESKGFDKNGQFLLASRVSDGVFEKGQLYRVTLEVTPPPSNKQRYYLTLEDFAPGGWKPIRGIFQTTSIATREGGVTPGYWNGWSHVESRHDRIFATSDFLWSSEPQKYIYYFRPEYSGEYLLPPATAYFLYRPEIFATTKYERIIVK